MQVFYKEVLVVLLSRNYCGVQGDARFAKVLEKMGADVQYGPNSITVSRKEGVSLVGVDEDCGDIPDVAMTLAVVGLFAKVVIHSQEIQIYSWNGYSIL